MKKNLMKYKDYYGSVEWSETDKLFYGKILGITGLFSYEGKDIKELKRDFEECVDDYYEFCKDHNLKPETPFKGSINIRVSPDMHKKAFNMAYDRNVTLNTIVNEALKAYLL